MIEKNFWTGIFGLNDLVDKVNSMPDFAAGPIEMLFESLGGADPGPFSKQETFYIKAGPQVTVYAFFAAGEGFNHGSGDVYRIKFANPPWTPYPFTVNGIVGAGVHRGRRSTLSQRLFAVKWIDGGFRLLNPTSWADPDDKGYWKPGYPSRIRAGDSVSFQVNFPV